jgi:hypothetical protein
MSNRFILGPRYEYIDWELALAFDAVKKNYETAWKLPVILNSAGGDGYWGPARGISGPVVRNSYKDTDVNHASFGGEQDDYDYHMREGRKPYELAYSQNRNGIKFTEEMIRYTVEAEIRRAEVMVDEETDCMRECMERINHLLLGVNGIGTGNFIFGHNTPDIWGARTIALNTNPFYNINPRPPELNFQNPNTVVVPANGLASEMFRVQELCGADHEVLPVCGIAPLSVRRYFMHENITPMRSINVDVNKVQDSWDEGVIQNEIRMCYLNNDIFWIFDSDMPGTGPGSADNEFLLFNPQKVQVEYMPGMFLEKPYYHNFTQTSNPLVYVGDIFFWFYMHWLSPKSHAYGYGYTFPVIT